MARLKKPNPYGSLVAVPDDEPQPTRAVAKKTAPKTTPAKVPKPETTPALKGQPATAARPLKPVRLNLDISPELHTRLSKRAHQKETSVSAWVRGLIEADLDEPEG